MSYSFTLSVSCKDISKAIYNCSSIKAKAVPSLSRLNSITSGFFRSSTYLPSLPKNMKSANQLNLLSSDGMKYSTAKKKIASRDSLPE